MNQDFSSVFSLIEKHPTNIFNSPSFQNYLKEAQSQYDTETDDKVKYYIFGKTFCAVNSTIQICKVWSDLPVDYFRNYIEVLESFLNLNSFSDPVIANWFSNQMNYRSFFNMMSYFLRKKPIHETNELFSDTVRQIPELINRKVKEVIDPGLRTWRWRLLDFHDAISDLFIEHTTEDLPLPTKSIKSVFVKDKWTIYQPDNKIVLAKWAGKVRNCVLTRTEEILENRSEIILIEKEGYPEYTVEINTEPERSQVGLKVKEIKGRFNTTLPSETQKMFEELIMNAIGMK